MVTSTMTSRHVTVWRHSGDATMFRMLLRQFLLELDVF